MQMRWTTAAEEEVTGSSRGSYEIAEPGSCCMPVAVTAREGRQQTAKHPVDTEITLKQDSSIEQPIPPPSEELKMMTMG